MAATENTSRLLRPAEDVLAGLWEAVWGVDTIRSLDLESLSMSIQQGELLLEGHLASETSRWHILGLARDAAGPMTIRDHLVVDRDLAEEVARGLAGDERTRPFVLPVVCDHGWIWLNGQVPHRQVQLAAEEVAARVPHGRGVVALPRVAGESPTPTRRALQPRPGSRVWGEDGEVGRVAQVVINPRSRLVTHMVVASSEVQEFRRLQGDYVVPIEAIETVNAESVFLAHPHRLISSFPELDASAYRQAPASWAPPYPYRAEAIRWQQGAPRPDGEQLTSGPVPPSSIRNALSLSVPSPAAEGGLERPDNEIHQGGAS
jgi:hypothetical protein